MRKSICVIFLGLLAGLLMPLAMSGATRESGDSVRIFFRQSRVEFVPGLNGNKENVERFAERVRELSDSGVKGFKGVKIVGSASPEGSVVFNRWLSEHRAAQLMKQLGDFGVPDNQIAFEFLGRNWRGLLERVRKDENVPSQQETAALIESIIAQVEGHAFMQGDPLTQLKSFKGGEPYRYMYREIFPDLRASWLTIWWDVNHDFDTVALGLPAVASDAFAMPQPADMMAIGIGEAKRCRPFYLGIKTNMLFDAMVIPNLGFDVYLGKNWSLNGNWMYTWFKSDRHHRYWRTYGGDLEVRYWFGKAAHQKPLTGHHVGVYGGIVTYDFEWGGRGYLGDKWSYFAGVSYGYSLPVSKRLNIDFVLGVGYLGGEYKEYVPDGDCYVWQTTKQRHWIGPTKAEISLVWLIGCDNFNRRKGGKR